MTCPDSLFRARCTLNSLTPIPPSKLSRASMVDSLVDASCKQDTSPKLCSTPTSKGDAANIVSRMVIWCNRNFPFYVFDVLHKSMDRIIYGSLC